ncbi:hypothetical protein D3C80_2028470 [compost metagenome]
MGGNRPFNHGLMQNIIDRLLELNRTLVSGSELGFHRSAQAEMMAEQHLHIHIRNNVAKRIIPQYMPLQIRRSEHRRIR